MNTAQQASTAAPAKTEHFAKTLRQEASELDALHRGLLRHLTVWRDAHEAATLRIGAVMGRMDAILERLEHGQTAR